MELHYLSVSTHQKNRNMYGIYFNGMKYNPDIEQEKKKQLRILIVCSENRELHFYKQLIIDLGYNPSTVELPSIAIEVFSNYHKHGKSFDIVFTDYILSGMNGITLAKILRNINPDSLFVMFPFALFYNSAIKKNYDSFGGFIQKIPVASFLAYKAILAVASNPSLRAALKKKDSNGLSFNSYCYA